MSDLAKRNSSASLPATNRVETVRDMLMRSRDQLQMALPKHLSVDRMVRIAMTTLQSTPKLLDCDPKTLIGCVMQSAQLGLEPDGILGHAYILPYGNKAQLLIGYKGLIALARRSGQVLSISAQVVYENDYFSYSYGLNETLEHKPVIGDRGKAVCVYAVARMRDGAYAFEVMSVADIEKIRQSSKAGNSGPWVTHWDEMARKTVVRRLAKYLPLSVEFQRAAALDEVADLGIDQGLVSDALETPSEKSQGKLAELKDALKKKAAKAGKQPQTPPEDVPDFAPIPEPKAEDTGGYIPKDTVFCPEMDCAVAIKICDKCSKKEINGVLCPTWT